MNTLDSLPNSTRSNLKIAMTLSALAYDTTANIGSQLNNPNLATGRNWEILWGPCELNSNMMYLAKNNSTNEYMVAIRGTIKSEMSVFEDTDILKLVPLPWLNNHDVMISAGIRDGWSNLNNMYDPNVNSSLSDYIDVV